MPINTSQSRQAPHSLVLGPFGGGLAKTDSSTINLNNVAISTSMIRFYCPPASMSKGMVIRNIRGWCMGVVAVGDASIDVLNGQTSMLDSVLTFAAVTSKTFTLANDGTEFVSPGNYLRVSGTEGSAGTWDSTKMVEVWVQIDYDLL